MLSAKHSYYNSYANFLEKYLIPFFFLLNTSCSDKFNNFNIKFPVWDHFITELSS